MKKKKNDHNRLRNRSITFRLTPEEEVRIRERINVLGIPMQEFFLNAFTDTKIDFVWGMFESERLAIEIRNLRMALEEIDPNEMIDDVLRCRICLEEIEDILRCGHQLPEEMP